MFFIFFFFKIVKECNFEEDVKVIPDNVNNSKQEWESIARSLKNVYLEPDSMSAKSCICKVDVNQIVLRFKISLSEKFIPKFEILQEGTTASTSLQQRILQV